ncbi:SbcC/MukB-like Walker B domain-containing protein [Actinoplanes sp. NPDC048988]|uniref:SbcC/MukB-like Walker B domain-containing protein n=1 Tax=Actinoplanes sp. NPDC048988 TaxID=3363901 RepID=UPI003717A41C
MSLIAYPGRWSVGDEEQVSDGTDGPMVAGRWQPTRAGAVNSWAWTDETFVFADGWLALAGPNGSGKSLTASMLVTVLLDGEVSQKALSVSGEAAGTLIDRHTDRNAKEDRTGVWWLEYGYRDPETGDVRYMSTGLWLRSQSSGLQKAFFLSPGRVGTDLLLQRQRDPVSIEGLAEQVTAADGRLFTSHERLTAKIREYSNIADENQYRDAIRTTLFAPLDSVQFDALVGVLRSLRSVRTAEAISPNQMRSVLTEALPALDPRALQFIADTMERIADLEEQLKRARAEIRQLEQSEQHYQRYIDAVIAEEAGHLAHAQTVFDDHARQARLAEQQRDSEDAAARRVSGRRQQLRTETADVRGRLQAAEDALREHAGAELPHLEQRLHDLRQRHGQLEQARDDLQTEAKQAAERALESAGQVHSGQEQLTGISSLLRTTAAEVGAQAFVDRLADATERVATLATVEHIVPNLDVQRLTQTPRGWAEARTTSLNGIDTALHKHDLAQAQQRTEAGHLRTAENEYDRIADLAADAAADRRAAEQAFLTQLHVWDEQRLQLPAVPAELSVDAEDRIDPAQLVEWLHRTVNSTRDRIALAAREQDVRHRTDAVEKAAGVLRQATAAREQAERDADQADRRLAQTREQAEQQRTEADAFGRQAHIDHDAAGAAARQITTAAEHALEASRAAASQAARQWVGEVVAWQAGLVHLDGRTVTLPDDPDAIDVRQPFVDLERAHAAALSGLHRAIADADRAVAEAEGRAATIETDLAAARRQPPVPQAPPWRSPRDPHAGVPLWATVAFADHVSADEANLIEGALLTAGLLDALVTADGLVNDGDLLLAGDSPAPGRSLADVLTVEARPDVDPQLVGWLLRAVAIDLAGSDLRIGRLRTGAVIATAPRGYQATFIGATARERARLAQVADLEQQLAQAHADVRAARQQRKGLHTAVEAAGQERDRFPGTESVSRTRAQVTAMQLELAAARQQTAQALAAAAADLTTALARVADLHREIDRTVEQARLATVTAGDDLRRAREAESDADAALRSAQEELAEAVLQRDDARTAEQQCTVEQNRFPDLDELRRTSRDEDDTARDEAGARAQVDEHRRRHGAAGEHVRQTLRELNTAATLPDGSILPTDRDSLQRHRAAVGTLVQQIDAWQSAASRTLELLKNAHRDHGTAARFATRLQRAAADADKIGLEADQLFARVEETRNLYGAEYAELRAKQEALTSELEAKEAEDKQLEADFREHDRAAASAQATLDGIAPRREEADKHRTACYLRVCLLVTHGFAALPETLTSDEQGRPANITAALTWSRQLLADKPATTARLDTLKTNRERAQRQLETTMRSVNRALAEFDQQLDSTTLEGTEWRRITLAAPNAAVGEDLRQAADTLRATAEGLEQDLRQDIKATLKTSMFTQLRRDIQTRREAARDLVRHIRATLEHVRTGVAQVGVQVDWKVRDDDNSQQMVTLLAAPPSDEVFDQMYAILRQRMEDAGDEPWTDRVAHTFDYRSWHQWDISVTHSSFGTDQFRPVNARSNPLKGLSTGESRLATMLPLLAAAWSMYSAPTFQGPRLLSIDEIDAAFDEPNLRQILALLRTWNFDVLATTPTIAPLIKRESQHVVVHEVVTDGRHRITVPWLWRGNGEPSPLTLPITSG